MDPFEWASYTSERHASSWRVEQAKEELQILEAQYPNRFNYLKVELKSFIFAESQKLHQNTTTTTNLCTSSTASTQASSSKGMKRKRKTGGSEIEKASEQKFQSWDEERVEAVVERAQACLRKIRDFKTNFF